MARTFNYTYETPTSADYNYPFFGDVVASNAPGAELGDAGTSQEHFFLEIPAGATAVIGFAVTAQKEYYYNQIRNYARLAILDADLAESYSIHLTSRVEPAAGSPDVVECGGSVFPTRYDNNHNTGPYNTGNMGYSYGICCEEVFYPMANCCSSADCSSQQYCVDGRCMDKRDRTSGLRGNLSVLVGYELSADNSCEVIDDIPAGVIDDYEKVDGFFDHMAHLYMNEDDSFIDFSVDKVIRVPLAMERAIWSASEVTSMFATYCPEIDLDAYDIVALTNQTAKEWVGGLALSAAHTVLYGQGTNSADSATHEIAHLWGCRDLYMDLAGRLQWFENLYGPGRYETINPAIRAGTFDLIEERALMLCRGRLGWVDADGNGVFDVHE